MARSRLARLAAAAALAALALTACAAPAPESGPTGPTELTFGIDRGPHSLDPYRSALGGQFLAYLDPVYDTLIHMETDGSFAPGLATEWEYLSPLEFRMVLREDVVFSDGETPFDAAAVQANLDRLTTVQGPQINDLRPMYDRTEIVGDHEVIVHLTTENPELERIFSQVLGMMSNPVAIATDAEALLTSPQGVGAYVLDEARTIPSDTYVYTKIDDYWDADSYPFDTLTVKVYTDKNAMLSALQSGVADVGYGAADNYAVAESSGLGIATRPVVLYMLNLFQRETTFADKRVRQALNYAIDREAILATLYSGEGVTTRQMFPEGEFTGYDPALEDEYPYDPDRARELLEEAGVGDGFTFTSALPVAARDTPLAEAVASYYAAIGVTMEIHALPPGTVGADASRPFDSTTTGYGGQGAFSDSQQLLFPTGTGLNPHNSSNEEFAELWTAAVTADDDEDRARGFQELSAAVVDEAWFVPVVRLNAIALFDTAVVSGVELTPGLSVPRIRGWQLAG